MKRTTPAIAVVATLYAFTATCESNRVEININTSRHQSTSSPLPFAYVCSIYKPLITSVLSTTRVTILWLKQPISSCIIDAMEVQTLLKVSTIASLLGFSLAFTVYKQGGSRHVLNLAWAWCIKQNDFILAVLCSTQCTIQLPSPPCHLQTRAGEDLGFSLDTNINYTIHTTVVPSRETSSYSHLKLTLLLAFEATRTSGVCTWDQLSRNKLARDQLL